MDEFEEAAKAAIDSIPPAFQPYLENTQFILEEGSPRGLMGLYEGGGAFSAGLSIRGCTNTNRVESWSRCC